MINSSDVLESTNPIYKLGQSEYSKPMEKAVEIRPINKNSLEERELVATRMRDTLTEVLKSQGEQMYSKDWLLDRVEQHIDGRLQGEIFLALLDNKVVGHTIVRKEIDGDRQFGLFSTIYVLPECRRAGVAGQLIETGETWFKERGLTKFVTYTSEQNQKLISLFQDNQYILSNEVFANNMVELKKRLMPA